MSDFNMFQSLWTNINDATVPKPLPGQPPQAVFLMEMPGYSVDPDTYDLAKFEPDKKMHPDRAVAMLVDRVPVLSPYFYDTGSHISFFWKQLVETFKLRYAPEDDPKLREKYIAAIKMLYGSEGAYIEQKKTKLFENLDSLRNNWLSTKEELDKFWKKCQTESGWPQNFQIQAGPYVQARDQAYTEYDNLKAQIEQYEAAIFQYTRGDLSRLMLQQAQGTYVRT